MRRFTSTDRLGLINRSCGRYVVAGLVAALMAVSFSLMANEAATAKPKKTVSNGCTAEQIQDPSAGPCINQLGQDTINGVAYPHQLMCDETGVYCCQSDGTRTFGCKKVASFHVPPNATQILKVPSTGAKQNPN